MNFENERITISIVSHGQASLIYSLLADFSNLPLRSFEVIITINIPEDESVYFGWAFPVRLIRNSIPKGFGANHNAAFLESNSNWFAVVNPDIRIKRLSIQKLLSPFANARVAAVAPIVVSQDGNVEDSARRFPTFLGLAKRVVLGKRMSDYIVSELPVQVDWLAGMFVVFRRDAFHQVCGFDEARFFMYMEDADICRRLRENNWHSMLNPSVQVVHLAQRASRKNLKHMRWHLVSAVRYLTGL